MKDGILLVLLCVLMLGGVVWYFMPGAAHELFGPARIVVKPQEPPSPKDRTAARPVRETTARGNAAVHSKRSTVKSPEPAAEADRTPAVEVIRTVAKPARFPAAKDIAMGAGISDVVDTFGDPALSAETQHRGHFLQTYVYRAEGSQAIIHFMDGKVTQMFTSKRR